MKLNVVKLNAVKLDPVKLDPAPGSSVELNPVELNPVTLNPVTLSIVGLAAGIVFGGILAGARLHEYDTIHSMLRLDDPYVFLFMGSAIAVSAPLLWLLERRGMNTRFGGKISLSKDDIEPHHVKGGALFGIGWAVAGTCPAPALVMLSSGALLSLVALPGIFVGLYLRERQIA